MNKRQRLNPDDARRNILLAAQKCLIEQGVDGLRIANVAAEAKIVHSSILHHFGSADGLRQALAKHLAESLFDDMTAALSAADTEDVVLKAIQELFEAQGPGGHANLSAWLLISGPKSDDHLHRIQEQYADLFESIIVLAQKNLTRIRGEHVALDEARFVVYLVLISACGQGILGKAVGRSLGIENKQEAFTRWLAKTIEK